MKMKNLHEILAICLIIAFTTMFCVFRDPASLTGVSAVLIFLLISKAQSLLSEHLTRKEKAFENKYNALRSGMKAEIAEIKSGLDQVNSY